MEQEKAVNNLLIIKIVSALNHSTDISSLLHICGEMIKHLIIGSAGKKKQVYLAVTPVTYLSCVNVALSGSTSSDVSSECTHTLSWLKSRPLLSASVGHRQNPNTRQSHTGQTASTQTEKTTTNMCGIRTPTLQDSCCMG